MYIVFDSCIALDQDGSHAPSSSGICGEVEAGEIQVFRSIADAKAAAEISRSFFARGHLVEGGLS